MNSVSRLRRSSPAVKWTVGYLIVWSVLLIEIRTLQIVSNWGHLALGLLSLPIVVYWLKNASRDESQTRRQRCVIGTLAFVVWWELVLVLLDTLVLDTARANAARWGTAGLFFIGLLWVVWGIERASVYYQQVGSGRTQGSDPVPPIWNPLNLDASFYAIQWLPPRPLPILRYLSQPRNPNVLPHGQRSRKLDQSFLALLTYTFSFLMLALLFSQIGGCREIYEMPAGGGEQKQLAQVVKIKKVIRKKYIINPLSSIIFAVPPIDDVQLELTETSVADLNNLPTSLAQVGA